MKGKATISDVASRANVSKATVSRVLNHNPQVKKEIRERVLKAIDELGYRPSAIARNLATKRTNMIGLILPDITNPYFPVLARGIEDAAHRLGYSLFISNTDNDPQLERKYIYDMVEQQVGGIVLISSSLDDQTMLELAHLDIPIVLCDRLIPGAPFNAVLIDDFRAAYEAVTYLIGQGHVRIAHLAGPNNIHSAESRKRGYLQAMQDAGLTPFVSVGEFNFESGVQQTAFVLEEFNPTALFASNDLLALGAIQEIRRRGIRIPENIAIIGCDDISFSRMSRPTLSTISIPAYQIGVTAGEILDQLVKGVKVGPKNFIIEHKLILRESTGGVG
jgi:LacI family transcriptional regulator